MNLKIILIICLINFEFSKQHELANDDCDGLKCAKLCKTRYNYYVKEAVTYINTLSRCEYYSYCSCFMNDFKTRLN